MLYKFILFSTILGVCISFISEAKENIASERDIRHEEKQQFGCDSVPTPANCYNETQGTILGKEIVLFGTPPKQETRVDADGLPIPQQQGSLNE